MDFIVITRSMLVGSGWNDRNFLFKIVSVAWGLFTLFEPALSGAYSRVLTSRGTCVFLKRPTGNWQRAEVAQSTLTVLCHRTTCLMSAAAAPGCWANQVSRSYRCVREGGGERATMRWQIWRRTPNAAILQQVGVPASETTSQIVTSTSSGC